MIIYHDFRIPGGGFDVLLAVMANEYKKYLIFSYLIDGQFIGIPLSDTFGALIHNRHSYVGAFQSHHRTSGATNITRTDTTHFHSTHYFVILGSALKKYMISFFLFFNWWKKHFS